MLSKLARVGAASVARPAFALRSLPAVTAVKLPGGAATLTTSSKPVQGSLDVPDPIEVFESIDTNGDGVLSRDEFLAACDALSLDELVAISKSLSRNELSRGATDEGESGGIVSRLITMADVTVSKIFPAGFGWQMASVYAEGAGMTSDSMPFFVSTGLGDMFGVWIGHTAFSAIKKGFGVSINMANEVQTGLLLGSAAFCSGFTWQPCVNALSTLGWSFNQVAASTVVACGTMFFVGLRLGRFVYSPIMSGIEGNSYANLKADFGLSVSIGGATGAFVGTDVSFGDANWLRPVVGVEEGFSDMLGQIKAGTSTSLGFVAFQTVQSFVVPKGKCWVD